MGTQEKILTDEARAFIEALHHRFNQRRLDLLRERVEVQEKLDEGIDPRFLESTVRIREDRGWRCIEPPHDLKRRFVEITGPVTAKMMINALNSGADVFMADFEDSLSPTYKNVIEGQANLIQAVRKTLAFTSPEGKVYALNEKTATLLVRPRGLHLEEEHYLVEGEPVSGAFFDLGLYLFHNAKELLQRGTGPYFYIPKLESAKEAALIRDLFIFAEKYLNLPQKSIKATVLIETILAAFQMEEILFEMKDYIVGLNSGRWDYIFSIIKKFSGRFDFIFPDRKQITMTTPFMKAYTTLLVKTCHQRGAHAIGGMSAFVPDRKNAEINERALDQVLKDKLREIGEGFDGTWVAHPDLVPLAKEAFEGHLGGNFDQKNIKRSNEAVLEKDLLNFEIEGGQISYEGIQENIQVSLEYLDYWLKGVGAVTINHLMEDAATAEISRAQLWQWIHHGAHLKDNGPLINYKMIAERLKRERDRLGNPASYDILKKVLLKGEFAPFITLEAYPSLNHES